MLCAGVAYGADTKPPPKDTTLTIIKKVVNDDPGGPAPPSVTFTVQVDCLPGGPHQTVMLNSSNGYSYTISGISAFGSCTFTEQPPPVPPELARKGCHWVIPSPGNPPKAAGSHREAVIVNHWVCNDSGTGKGTLKFLKVVVNGTGGPVPAMPTSFPMTADCTGMPQQSVSVSPGSAGVSITVSAPTSCLVKEILLTPIPHLEGCHGGNGYWTTTISPAQPMAVTANGTTMVTVTNRLTCNKVPT